MEAVMPIITGIAEERLIFLVIALAIVGVLLIVLIILQNISKKARKQKQNEKVVLENLFPDIHLATAIATSLGVAVEDSIVQSELDNVKKLVVEYSELKDLTGISQLKNLEEASLSNNKISELPDEISKLENLQNLQLAYNDITNIEPLAKNEKLRKLDVSGNSVSEKIETLYTLPELEDLVVINSGIDKITPGIEQAKSLKNLNMSYNDLKILPDEIGNLPQLESLNVGNNKLNTLPATLAQNAAIQEISLAGNMFEAIPNEVQEMMRNKNIAIPIITEKEKQDDANEQLVTSKNVKLNLPDTATLDETSQPEKAILEEVLIDTPKIEKALANKIEQPEHSEIVFEDETVQTDNEGEKEMSKKLNTFIDLTSSHDNLLAELEALETKAEETVEKVEKVEQQIIDEPVSKVIEIDEPVLEETIEKIEEVEETYETEPLLSTGEVAEEIISFEPLDEVQKISDISFTGAGVPSENTLKVDKKKKILKAVAITAGVAAATVAVVGGAYTVHKRQDAKKKKGIFHR